MFASLSLTMLFGVLAAGAAVVVACGLRMTGLADRIADRTGLGEALIGGVLLGAATSLSGSVLSLTAALEGAASLAFSNGIGGIAAQTAFLGVADLVYRKGNLEHAAAQAENLLQGALLMLLLSIPLLARMSPEIAVWGVHPASIAIVAVYCYGLHITRQLREQPMWRAARTPESREDVPGEAEDTDASPWPLLGVFAVLMAILALAGWTLAQTAAELTTRLGLSATLVGALMTAVITSMPELVTTVAAVRRGALQLAVGGIIGGNTFDTLFLTISDIGYRDGSIYHAVGPGDYFWLAVGLTMTAILVAGMIYRQRAGPVGIGVETGAMMLVYLGAIAVQVVAG